jgi:hypothetical protein
MNEATLVEMGFSPLTLADKGQISAALRADPPETSELTFTNLYMWRHHYHPWLKAEAGCVLVIVHIAGQEPFALPPLGAGDQAQALTALFAYLGRLTAQPSLRRVGAGFVRRHQHHLDPGRYQAVVDRAQSDYVYLTSELIALAGNRFHKKKNHLNKFLKTWAHEYRPLDQDLVGQVLAMQQDWCALRDCAGDDSLAQEDRAIYEALKCFGELDYTGAAILVAGKVEAFSLGEPLNPETAVIHIEKANPEISGLYAAMNQMFAARAWAERQYINREQDLGLEGLRAAKESYNPHHMVDKYIITPL